MSDRRVLAVSAAGITAAIFVFLLATFPSWKLAVGDGFSWHAEAPAGTTQAAPPQTATNETQSPAQRLTTPAPQPSPAPLEQHAAVPARPVTPPAANATTADAAPAPASETAPHFDIVRVEPSGESVVAARAKAGVTVTLLDQGRPIATAKADDNGQVAFVPPTLAPGEHSLMLSVGEPNTSGAFSSQSVAVSVPAQAKTAPLVALLQPDQPTKVLSGAELPGTLKGAKGSPTVSVGTIDVEEMGGVFATGHAPPGSQCRIYLNGSFVTNVTAGPDGAWALKIKRGMRPGHYNVRIDQLGSAAGDVQARAEVPFDYPAQASASISLLRPRVGSANAVPPMARNGSGAPASTTPAMGATASIANSGPTVASDASKMAAAASSAAAESATPTTSGVPAVVAQLLTTKVIPGDSLWRISRKMLGHGRRYTQIYAANSSQIRDPRLIYPGQIFVMPEATP